MNTTLRNNMLRTLVAAALLATLAACGNKGPLVKASQATPVEVPATTPATGVMPAPTPPVEPAPPADPTKATTPVEAPPADTGGGNG